MGNRLQRPMFPNLSIKLYDNMEMLPKKNYIELTPSVIVTTLRDTLFGVNEGILQFYDSRNLHTKLSGNEIIHISYTDQLNINKVINRVYAVRDFGVSTDNKGDNIIAMNIAPYHIVKNLSFSRAFMNDAKESIAEFMRVIYKGYDGLMPNINGENTFVPRVPWVGTYEGYCNYVRDIGIQVDTENFVFVWEDNNGINIKNVMNDEPILQVLHGDPSKIGDFITHSKNPIASNIEYITKSNPHERLPFENMTYYSYAVHTKKIERVTTGEGQNTAFISRSGGYANLTFSNGYEELSRILTLAQYDGYIKFELTGNNALVLNPGAVITINDTVKDQFRNKRFIISEVVREIAQETSRVTIYAMSNSNTFQDPETLGLTKVKTPELPKFSDEEVQAMHAQAMQALNNPGGGGYGSDSGSGGEFVDESGVSYTLEGDGVVVYNGVRHNLKVGQFERLKGIVTAKANANGIAPADLMAMCYIESRWDPNARRPGSSYIGLLQVHKDYGGVFDVSKNIDAAMKLMAANKRVHVKHFGANAPWDAGLIYLYHQQGMGGAPALLKGGNASAVATLTKFHGAQKARQVVRDNGGNVNLTCQQFANIWLGKARAFAAGYAGRAHVNNNVSSQQAGTTNTDETNKNAQLASTGKRYDISKMVASITAQAGNKVAGGRYCARAVRIAIHAGDTQKGNKGRSTGHARELLHGDSSGTLAGLGFKLLGRNYTGALRAGDVYVSKYGQAKDPNNVPYGHCAMYTGSVWKCDYTSKHPVGHSSQSPAKHPPEWFVYRPNI